MVWTRLKAMEMEENDRFEKSLGDSMNRTWGQICFREKKVSGNVGVWCIPCLAGWLATLSAEAGAPDGDQAWGGGAWVLAACTGVVSSGVTPLFQPPFRGQWHSRTFQNNLLGSPKRCWWMASPPRIAGGVRVSEMGAGREVLFLAYYVAFCVSLLILDGLESHGKPA